MEESQKATEERIVLRKPKGLRDDADVKAIAIVYMNRLVIPLCRMHFMVILRQQFLSFHTPTSSYYLPTCGARSPHCLSTI